MEHISRNRTRDPESYPLLDYRSISNHKGPALLDNLAQVR